MLVWIPLCSQPFGKLIIEVVLIVLFTIFVEIELLLFIRLIVERGFKFAGLSLELLLLIGRRPICLLRGFLLCGNGLLRSGF
jgi:hypothetical protein